MRILSVLLVSLIGVATFGCASGHCKKGKSTEATMTETDQKSDRVFVHKPDGSIQCQKDTGKSLDAMAKDLGSIKIYSKQKKSDGMMRPQVCGVSTGMSNVYEIDSVNLQKATDVGFKVWKTEGI